MIRGLVSWLSMAGLLLVLQACNPTLQRVTGGDDTVPVEGGIGGTGIEFSRGEGGIGGTGAPTRTAMIGGVTGFGSIHVNGLRVVFPAGERIASPDGGFSEAAIGLGETVEIIGARQADGTVLAREGMFRHPVIGRIERISADGRRMGVMGAEIVVEPGGLIVDGAGNSVALVPGDVVEVSGLPRGRQIIASRVERIGGDRVSSVMGSVAASPRSDAVRINGVTVVFEPGRGFAKPPLGVVFRFDGRFENGVLRPVSATPSLLSRVGTPIPDISIEGYLERRPSATGYAIQGLGPAFDAASRIEALAGDRAVFIGALENGTFRARHGLRLPENGPVRRTLLEAVEDGFAPAGAISTR